MPGISAAQLDNAALAFKEGLEMGGDPDELLAAAMGLSSKAKMSGIQDEYKDKIKGKLLRRAEELLSADVPGAGEFERGKKLYEYGRYPESVKALTAALDITGPFTKLGGDVQMWLALAHQACGDDKEAIAIYKAVEGSHPLRKTRQQAANLRFILEAPKLELSEDERVKIPEIKDIDRNRARGSAVVSRRPLATQKPKREKSWEEKAWENYRPPEWTTNRYVWFAGAVVAVGLIYWGELMKAAGM